MKKSYKSVAVIIAVVVAISMFFSMFFIASKAHHDCLGDECPICQQIVIAENYVRICGAGIIIFAASILWCISAQLYNKSNFKLLVKQTPVRLKVRLLN